MSLISIAILAKDEADNIGGVLAQLANQTLFTDGDGDHSINVDVVPNGCTDDTAARAQACAPMFAAKANTRFRVHDLSSKGKSRSWNLAVHQLCDQATDVFIFLDADIDLVDTNVLSEMLNMLKTDLVLHVVSGVPIKDAHRKSDKTLLERFSLAVSRNTRNANVVNGSLYFARGDVLRGIWMPDETPGEDGFLSAMITTAGFSAPFRPDVVREFSRPTHYFETLPPSQFFLHERRMIVGTMITRWLCEHLWSLKLTQPAGPLIDQWNRETPDWVETLIHRNAAGKIWLIPREICLGRFRSPRAIGWGRFLIRLPMALAATALTLPPAITANRLLHRRSSASYW